MYNCFACNRVVYEGISTATQTVAEEGNISFSKVLGAGDGLTTSEGVIQIAEPGIYLVKVSVTGATESAAGNMGIQLYNNTSAVTGALGGAYSSAPAANVNIAFSAIIKVPPTYCQLNDNSASLTLVNTGIEAVISNVIVTLVRL